MRVLSTLLILSACTFAQKAASPLEFEVASVKPNISGEENSSLNMTSGGLFTVRNVPLQTLIAFAFKVRGETLFGCQPWFESGRFMRNLEEVGGLTMFATLEKLGLKLEAKKIPLTVVVVDKSEKLRPE